MAMENVFRIKSSELIHIKSKFSQYMSNLCPPNVHQLPTTYEQIHTACGYQDSEDEQKIEDSISLDHLFDSNDLPISEFRLHNNTTKLNSKTIEIPSVALQLRSVRQRVEERNKKNASSPLKKYNRYQYIAPQYDNTSGVCDLAPFREVLIVVRVYEPFLYKRGKSNSRVPRLSQEFFVLGSQYLHELRDKIFCHCQFGPFYDVSNDFEEISKTATIDEGMADTSKTNQGGVFFITDAFYKDDGIDADKEFPYEITEWMRRQPEIGPFNVKSMQQTKFEDLSVRLGYPQLYRHYANCEHLVVFSDVRLLAMTDSWKITDYPMLRCVSTTRHIVCIVCGLNEAAFIVRNTNVHIHDPAYLCQNCLISFHYVDGQKMGTFNAYRYYGSRPIPNQ